MPSSTDLDLAFGTAGLDYNQDPPQGIADAVFSPDRIDTNFIDRLLSKCTDHLSLLAAPATLDRVYDFGAEAFEPIFDSLRATVPCIVLDVPHQWTGWTQRTLVSADEILIVAAPDLANLRNAKNLVDLLQRRARRTTIGRSTASTRSACRNGRRSSRRISPRRWTTIRSRSSRSSRRLFGTAANNGQMIAEVVRQPQGRRDPSASSRSCSPAARKRSAQARPVRAAAAEVPQATG